jgi:hypothetical protein
MPPKSITKAKAKPKGPSKSKHKETPNMLATTKKRKVSLGSDGSAKKASEKKLSGNKGRKSNNITHKKLKMRKKTRLQTPAEFRSV